MLPSMDDYLTECGRTNLAQVEQFLEYLGGIEDQAGQADVFRAATNFLRGN